MNAFAAKAAVGNMGHGDCPSVTALQDYAAKEFGAEAALFTLGGTRSNQIAIRLHAPSGSKVFCAASSHIDTFAEGVFAREPIKLQAVHAPDHAITASILQDVLESQMDRAYAAPASAIVLENTMGYHGGAIYSCEEIKAVSELAHDKGLKVHVDGARILHASISESRPVSDYMQHVDTMSVCLAKGLGAPQGSVLLGSEEAIAQAKTVQRQLGDNFYGVGGLAAAGLYALKNNAESLQDDHEKARSFQRVLSASDNVTFMHEEAPTNMVLFNVSALNGLGPGNKAHAFTERLKDEIGVKLYCLPQNWVRAVAHHSVSAEQTNQAAHATLDMINTLG